MSNPAHPWETEAWQALSNHAAKLKEDGTHLRDLMQDKSRCKALQAEFDDILYDFSRQRLTTETFELLMDLLVAAGVTDKIKDMAQGVPINTTENRAVMHMALRAPKGYTFKVDGADVVPDVHQVLDRIYDFATKVRSGESAGATKKKLINVISIGIGGSYLGPEFVYEALKTSPVAAKAAEGRTLRFLANVDPVDVKRATAGLDPEETLVIIVSKTFTTAETMLNARTCKDWLASHAKAKGIDPTSMIAKHMIAVSANVPAAESFGIATDNVFGFWDWVGGRYSVCSAVGVVPLALQYGKDQVDEFLAGAHGMDVHFQTAEPSKNLPILMGLMGVWNSTFLQLPVRALLPYS